MGSEPSGSWEEFEDTKEGNLNLYIEEEQTTQWPKEKVQNDRQRSTNHTYKTKDQVTWTPIKTEGELVKIIFLRTINENAIVYEWFSFWYGDSSFCQWRFHGVWGHWTMWVQSWTYAAKGDKSGNRITCTCKGIFSLFPCEMEIQPV